MGYFLLAVNIVLVIIGLAPLASSQQCDIEGNSRFDCYPELTATQEKCEGRGCCWQPVSKNLTKGPFGNFGQPYCFYPKNFPSYTMSMEQSTNFGLTANLSRTTTGYFPKDVMDLKLDVYFETPERLHFKIYDPKNQRYEVPIETPKVTTKETNPGYKLSFTHNPFGLAVTRAKTGKVLFNTSVTMGAFMFADQFIQISTYLASNYLYGLGEHRGYLKRSTEWAKFPFWNRDNPPMIDANLYGHHPFYIGLEPESGMAHGVFLLNSNAMDVALNPLPALTYRTIGGILDFYIFLGPSPENVVQQYTEVVGRPFHPPYWGLGFHLCRYNYNSANKTMEIVEKMRQIKMPQDTQWNDIDYMVSHEDFTYDHTAYKELPQVVQNLQDHRQHYIPILDPAIFAAKTPGTYPPYDDGVKKDVFVKDASGKILIGQVWPGDTAFPDFFNPATQEWWETNLKNYHSEIPFNGIWLDMNEPSNFISGDTAGCPNNGTYEDPPYVPGIVGGKLNSHTLCASAMHHIGRHYDLHSLYGLSEVMATNKALTDLLQKRPFIISRSSFASLGKYGGHWSGDNRSLWPDIHYSITAMLDFNMFGIPLVGSDICGFGGDTTEELCTRWMQLGSFYPFSRNHNDAGARDQDPTQWSTAAQDAMRSALQTRYYLLPYLYTLFTDAHANGTTVARPLFFEFPDDPMTYAVDRQFLWGPALLISPVLDEGARTVHAVFPAGVWYDFYNGSMISNDQTTKVTLDAPLNVINLHVREGHILPAQQPNTTTNVSRQNPFEVIAAINSKTGAARGSLYWDDGDSLGTFEAGKYISIAFTVDGNIFTSRVISNNFPESMDMLLGVLKVYGVMGKPKTVTINGNNASFQYNLDLQTLTVQTLPTKLDQEIMVKWL